MSSYTPQGFSEESTRWGPTRAQQGMLRQIHAAALSGTQILTRIRQHGEYHADIAPAQWYREFDATGERGQHLASLAHAGGIPDRWIEYARRAGELGEQWNRPRWPNAEPVDRDRLMANLTTQARGLRDMTAVHVAYRDHASLREPTQTMVQMRHNTAVVWEHINGLAQLVGLDVDERARLWPGHNARWLYTAAEAAHTLDPERLARRWRRYAAPLAPTAGLQVELLRAAGIATDSDDAALPPLTTMTDQLATALASIREPVEHLAEPNTGSGAAIGAAINSALHQTTGPGTDLHDTETPAHTADTPTAPAAIPVAEP
ncbi:hypothetical protein K7711_36520 [Nocardia sp. CA2R105]|uniref:hypothetical protein n=1 Tax=Nocardia coffeae TaxID=2873381 RepID=UPI001CA7619B|nr:hypothetical protein [Nocardia coffeae]MBY8862029.1 hypothetical protein [Nocardia coffeae]